jgi:hypothetical protein
VPRYSSSFTVSKLWTFHHNPTSQKLDSTVQLISLLLPIHSLMVSFMCQLLRKSTLCASTHLNHNCIFQLAWITVKLNQIPNIIFPLLNLHGRKISDPVLDFISLLAIFATVYTLVSKSNSSGFGGLGVACWPLVPKFTGSNLAKDVGFLRAKKSSANLPLEWK